MKTPKQPTRTLPANAFSVGGFIVFTFGHCSTCGGTFTAYVTTEEWEAGCGAPAWGECSGCGAT